MGQSGMKLRNSASGLRSLIPQAARERLYAWHPGRARRWQTYPGLERVEPRGHAVLTFDDGPDPDATPAVLDALDRAGVRATFFLLGTQVESHPALGREVVERGHEIALHGYGHERQDRIDSDRSDEDMRRGYSVLEKHLGVQCRWYRPPYGKMSDGAARTCASLGMSVVYWSAWGLDWEEVGAARIADVVSDQLDDGGILLLHDSARHARRASAAATADALEIIAENARERGMSLISLGEALAYAGSVA
jgi:peptidoglycan-N-acetylglucosamine deacetylase